MVSLLSTSKHGFFLSINVRVNLWTHTCKKQNWFLYFEKYYIGQNVQYILSFGPEVAIFCQKNATHFGYFPANLQKFWAIFHQIAEVWAILLSKFWFWHFLALFDYFWGHYLVALFSIFFVWHKVVNVGIIVKGKSGSHQSCQTFESIVVGIRLSK